ncbi:MAG: hypothetical protein ABI724_18905 [Betaproteobacteria bacterium]
MRSHTWWSHAALLPALALCACTAALVTADAPKSVKAHPILPNEWHEECLHLAVGDRVEFAFESTQPVDFNIHYHEGKTVVMPISRNKTQAESGVFASPIVQDYCLMWEAGVTGAAIDYRIRLKPAGA